MQHDDVNLRIAAGEVFALVCELGRAKIENFEPRQFGVLDILKDLATDGTKHRAKKDRRQQRSSFRDILRAIEVGCNFFSLHGSPLGEACTKDRCPIFLCTGRAIEVNEWFII